MRHRRLRQAEKQALLVKIIGGPRRRDKIGDMREGLSLLQPGKRRDRPHIHPERLQQRHAKHGLQAAFLIDEGNLLMPFLASVNLNRYEPRAGHLPALSEK